MLALRLSPFAHAAMRPLCASSRAYLSSSWRDALSNIPQTVTAFVTSSSGSGRRRPSDLLEYSDEVREALDRGLPLVALESTIISHGMPYPRNLEVARQIEETVRRHGAVPATVAIIGGQPKVGLGAADLETLARNTAGEVMKASRRDLGFAITNKRHAATTVASTMILAHLAGIRVFATGGIGGVHRGAEATMDVSADLQELARTPVTVVCAGVKSILDIPKTLEYLETQGVPVITLGADTFPAFFTSDSGLRTPLRLDSTLDVARLLANCDVLGMGTGELLAVPNPDPADSLEVQAAIEAAIARAVQGGISGAAVTPFVLAEVERTTEGRSLKANVALVLNNAAVAARVAVAYAGLQKPDDSGGSSSSTDTSSSRAAISSSSSSGGGRQASIVAVGGAVVDLIARSAVPLVDASSNPGSLRTSYGGVARNVSEALSERGVDVALVTAVGDDPYGRELLVHARRIGIDVSLSTVLCPAEGRTATYLAVHDSSGDLVCGVADMDLLLRIQLSPAAALRLAMAEVVVVDGNVSAAAFTSVCDAALASPGPLLFFEPTSDHKCLLPVLTGRLHCVDIVKPNRSELLCMVESAVAHGLFSPEQACAVQTALASARSGEPGEQLVGLCLLARALHSCLQARPEGRPLRRKHVVVTLGARGLIWATDCSSGEGGGLFPLGICQYQPAIPIDEVERADPNLDFNGAGDAFCGGLLSALLRRGELDQECLEAALEAARRHSMRHCQADSM